MYIPEHFQPAHSGDPAALVEGNPFGMLVTVPGGVPFISHLPFLYERSNGPHGRLYGHMARSNLQWQHLLSGETVLVVFQGPHAYISPNWYNSPGVPTWNYAVAHLRGSPHLIEGEAELEDLLKRQTGVYESPQATPWDPTLTGERRSRLLSMIVGFEIDVSDVQAKFKLSQNRPLEDRQAIIEKLSQSASQADHAVARLMAHIPGSNQPT